MNRLKLVALFVLASACHLREGGRSSIPDYTVCGSHLPVGNNERAEVLEACGHLLGASECQQAIAEYEPGPASCVFCLAPGHAGSATCSGEAIADCQAAATAARTVRETCLTGCRRESEAPSPICVSEALNPLEFAAYLLQEWEIRGWLSEAVPPAELALLEALSLPGLHPDRMVALEQAASSELSEPVTIAIGLSELLMPSSAVEIEPEINLLPR